MRSGEYFVWGELSEAALDGGGNVETQGELALGADEAVGALNELAGQAFPTFKTPEGRSFGFLGGRAVENFQLQFAPEVVRHHVGREIEKILRLGPTMGIKTQIFCDVFLINPFMNAYIGRKIAFEWS